MIFLSRKLNSICLAYFKIPSYIALQSSLQKHIDPKTNFTLNIICLEIWSTRIATEIGCPSGGSREEEG
jgi:hypothetical protein